MTIMVLYTHHFIFEMNKKKKKRRRKTQRHASLLACAMKRRHPVYNCIFFLIHRTIPTLLYASILCMCKHFTLFSFAPCFIFLLICYFPFLFLFCRFCCLIQYTESDIEPNKGIKRWTHVSHLTREMPAKINTKVHKSRNICTYFCMNASVER